LHRGFGGDVGLEEVEARGLGGGVRCGDGVKLVEEGLRAGFVGGVVYYLFGVNRGSKVSYLNIEMVKSQREALR
jgi:hypothetical protein